MRLLLVASSLVLAGCPLTVLEVHDGYGRPAGAPFVFVEEPAGGQLQLLGPALPVIPGRLTCFAEDAERVVVSVPQDVCVDGPGSVRLVTRTGAIRPASWEDEGRSIVDPRWLLTFVNPLRRGQPIELLMDDATAIRLTPTRTVSLWLSLIPMMNPCTWRWGWSYALPELPPVDAP
jgi:hypothetical protein